VEQASVQVPAELVMGPRCDLWADPDHLAAFERASTTAERMTPRDSCMIGAWRNHQDAIHAWAGQMGRTWRQARALIPSRRPYWRRGGGSLPTGPDEQDRAAEALTLPSLVPPGPRSKYQGRM